jgi:hypothetical protein
MAYWSVNYYVEKNANPLPHCGDRGPTTKPTNPKLRYFSNGTTLDSAEAFFSSAAR